MRTWNRGDFVELDGLLTVIVGIDGDKAVPEDHLAVWFGVPRCKRVSEAGVGGQQPEVWTVPAEYCAPARSPIYKY